MEVEFDKEIDALMRGGALAVGGSPTGGHLDADEIAAFAENAMPERSRALYLRHFADCDRCRQILSNLIALNAEAEPEKAAAAVPLSIPAVTETPWYRKLFLFPNLAYVMGGLVLMLGGLIGLSVFQGSLGDSGTSVSDRSERIGSRADGADGARFFGEHKCIRKRSEHDVEYSCHNGEFERVDRCAAGRVECGFEPGRECLQTSRRGCNGRSRTKYRRCFDG